LANNLWIDPETGEVLDNMDENALANIVDWFEQYIWVPESSGGQFELAHPNAKIVTAIPGLGVLGGYNPKMTNVNWNHSSAYHREAWNEYPGEAHPGRGAYSNYYNLELASTEEIPAGREIFLNYGENWDNEDDDDDDDDEKEDGEKELTRQDYIKVDKTIQKLIEFFDKYKDDLDEVSKKEIHNFVIHDVMLAAAGKSKGAKIANLLPKDPNELKNVLKNGGSFYLTSPTAFRDMKWLKTNGLCMDNIRPGPSTIPYAGRGAFGKSM
jgi:hypothetical protein